MRIKTYVFDDVKEGMKKIKEEHGVDTIIVDIKHNGVNGPKKGCEISVAVEGDRAVQGDDLGDLRRRMEGVWDHTTRYLAERVNDMGTEMIKERIKTYPLPLRILFDKMVKNGFNAESAVSVLAEVHCSIGPLSEDSLKAAFFVKRTLASRIRVQNPIYSTAPIVVAGPSGGGKSETSLKLAAMCAEEAVRVAVIAFDPTKKKGHDGMRAFCTEKGIPFAAVFAEEDLFQGLAVEGVRKIVDLSGPLDMQKKTAEKIGNGQTVLVLPAGAREEKIEQCCDRFKGHNLAGLIITKLDEEETVGHIFDSLLKIPLPLCFFTSGNNEKDILTPSSDLLYKTLIEGNTWKRKESVLLP